MNDLLEALQHLTTEEACVSASYEYNSGFVNGQEVMLDKVLELVKEQSQKQVPIVALNLGPAMKTRG